MQVNIHHRWTPSVQFTIETPDQYSGSKSVALTWAIQQAIKTGANLRGADLRDANLRDANLRGADLRYANLGGADLGDANLRGADLRDANLGYANLGGADLRDANLRGADLRYANLGYANLGYADLGYADLMGANLGYANLGGADLRDANLRGAKGISTLALAQTCITPEGNIIGWKKCRDNRVVKLYIPAEARRSNSTGRKCRAEFADCLEVIGGRVGISKYDPGIVYQVGKRVVCDKWCEDRWEECGGGIHFFLTREEAEAYD